MDNIWFIAATWMGLAFAASLISVRLGISVSLVEIAVGIFAGNFLGLQTNEWVNFLASLGSLLLTFLAGAELGQAEDWEGNNIAVTCPVCGKVYIVSARIHRGKRACPTPSCGFRLSTGMSGLRRW